MEAAQSRESMKVSLSSAVEQFLDHVFNEDEQPLDQFSLGAIVIASEVFGEDSDNDQTVVPTYWCSNENAIWQRGFFEILADYRTVPPTGLSEE